MYDSNVSWIINDGTVSRSLPLVKVPRSTQQQEAFDFVHVCYVLRPKAVISVDLRGRGLHTSVPLDSSVTDELAAPSVLIVCGESCQAISKQRRRLACFRFPFWRGRFLEHKDPARQGTRRRRKTFVRYEGERKRDRASTERVPRRPLSHRT
jgi:hypothetical protein